MEKEPVINQYLRRMLELGGSDLHLSINFPAKARVHGNIQLLDDDVLDAPRMEELMKEICLPAWRWTKFMETHDLARDSGAGAFPVQLLLQLSRHGLRAPPDSEPDPDDGGASSAEDA